MVFLHTKTKFAIAGIAAIVVIVIFWGNPIISNSYKSRGKLSSEKSFIIRTNASGALESFLINNKSGKVENYSIFNFERGDVIDFQLFSESDNVNPGDTLVQFSSSKYKEEIAELNITLTELEGSLSIFTSGQKQEVLNELKLRVSHAEEQVKTEEKIYERSKMLLQKNIISQQDFDIVEGQMELYKIELSIAKQMLKTAETGEKPQEIRAVENQLEQARNLVTILNNRVARLKITCPIEGRIFSYAYNDTLLVVNSNYDRILQLPVPATRTGNISPGDSIYIYCQEKKVSVGISAIDENVFFHNGKPYIKITSEAFRTVEYLPVNSVLPCEIDLGKTTLVDYLKEVIN